MIKRREITCAAMMLCAVGLPLRALGKATNTTLYNFTNGSDGRNPQFGLTKLGATIYGGTVYGGANGQGVYFSITDSGQFTIVHTVTGNGDATPYEPMLAANGALYGYGCNSESCVLYRMTPDGAQNIVYAFTGENAPLIPEGVPVELNGKFYGISEEGGSANAGVVFSVSKAGKMEALHTFDVKDGADAQTGLTIMDGTLYGVTSQGGPENSGDGTAFSVTPDGAFTLLYSFEGDAVGFSPYGTLLAVNGTLYGTTDEGGSSYYR
ncbi:MAG TPA: choice-of-anchor tandem repeat GloVer-containing protein, partial [Acetobacteraceae bacterium]|nr:choice-of-anchor tandem repeat GloVer-containing protein [Acetobacteraceae bacterium]